MLLAFAVECGVGQFFQQGVCFAIENAVSLLDDGVPDGLGAVTLAASSRYQNIMPIVRRKPRFTTSGIRCGGRISAFEDACSCRVGSTSLASFRMEPSVAFQHG